MRINSYSQYEKPSTDTLGRLLALLGLLKFDGRSSGVFHSPEIVNGGSDAKDPFRVIAQFLQRDAGEVFDSIVVWVAQGLKKSLGNKKRHIMRRNAQ
jgi:hypothetical protein